MLKAIKDGLDALTETPRDMLDESGLWPRDLIPKLVVVGTYAVSVCVMAHIAPFTMEAFITALLAYGLTVVGYLIFGSIVAGVLAAVICVYESKQYPARTAAEIHQAAMGRAFPLQHPEGKSTVQEAIASTDEGSDAVASRGGKA